MKALRSTTSANDEARLHKALHAGDWPALTRLCRQTLRKNGKHLLAHRLLGFSLSKQRQPDEALTAFDQAVRHHPDDAELLINYGNLLIDQARNNEALPLLEKVCKLRPLQAISWIKLAQCCYLLGLHEKGFAASLKSTELASDLNEQVASLTQRAIHRRELGQVREAVKDCEAAIALRPSDPSNHTNRLLFMLADPQVDAAQMAQAAREYAAVFESPLKGQWPTFEAHAKDPWRKLKIGFISPDFRVHAVMYFIEGLLATLDRRQFEVYAFYTYPRDDHVTERVQKHADQFVRLAGMTSLEQAQKIRDQEIDILIDLAGHTGHNALLAMAHRAAPVQVSWLGFPATTGLSAIDYKFSDEVTDPPDVTGQYSENLYRLPTFFTCYRPMSREPLWRYQPRYLVHNTPALNNGFITFGSCNNLGKLTDEVLTLWGRLLASVPNSRLLIEGKNLGDPEFAAEYRERCKRLGMDDNRLDLLNLDTANQYLTYHQIDIALDSFPLNGGTTSFDVLWMGVPLVSKVGKSFKSRMGTGMLSYLGRDEWLAHSDADYIRIAMALASDALALNTIRRGLRSELENSALMRDDIFNHHFSEGLRAMWLHWMAQTLYPDDADQQVQAMGNWTANFPGDWLSFPAPSVGIATGERISQQEAHLKLNQLLDIAKRESPAPQTDSGHIENKHWAATTRFAETLLCAVPHDPVALTVLAEIELAHGHPEFATTYLRYATESLTLTYSTN